METAPATVVLIGCGVRGQNYTTYALAHPDRLKVVGIAEPRDFQRNMMKERHRIQEENVFTDWRELVRRDRFADGAIIATLTKFHQEPAIALAKKGYHLMQETPMAITEEGCQEVYDACLQNGVMLCTCHVLRYSPPANKIKELIDVGAVGEVVNIQHIEMYGTVYGTHSAVRGTDRYLANAGNFLLGKSCHDFDLIAFWLGDRKCLRVSAFGHVSHFNTANKPLGSSSRCWNCSVERNCPYSAIKTYIEPVQQGFTGFPVNCVADVIDAEHVTEAIKSGPFGRCVYDMDNETENHVVINLQFEGGATASHTVVTFSELNGTRETKIFGTMGEIRCRFGGPVEHYDFRTRTKTVHEITLPEDNVPEPLKHYWGSDYNVIHSFATALRDKTCEAIRSGPVESLASHRVAFASDCSLRERRVVELSWD